MASPLMKARSPHSYSAIRINTKVPYGREDAINALQSKLRRCGQH